MQNGKRVMFRGDVEQMQAQLEQNNVPPGFAKYENGKPVGIYYPAEMKDRVSQALNYSENANAPSQVEVPSDENAQNAAPAENAQPEGRTAGVAEVGGVEPVQPNGDGTVSNAADANADVTDEHTAYNAPKPGSKFVVYRLGEGNGLENRNAGNAQAVARYIAGTQDIGSPLSSQASKVSAYEVTAPDQFGPYAAANKGRTDTNQSTVGRGGDAGSVQYSFPDGFQATKIGEKSLDELHAELAKDGYENFDDSGSIAGGNAIRRAFGQKAADPVTQRLMSKLKDHDAAVQEYNSIPDTKGGTVLNTDTARELSPDYLADRTLSAAVHEPASAFIKQLYAEKLADPTPEGKQNTVLFTAGGTGAGKSTGLSLLGDHGSEMTYDTNMNTFDSADAKVKQALDAGRNVHVAYTYRDPKDALVNGALPRAEGQANKFGSGRTVPIDEHIKTHQGALDTITQLQQKYADNPNVKFTTIDNSHGKGNARVVDGLDKLDVNPDNFKPEVLKQALDNEHQAGRISDATYRGFAGEGSATRGRAEQAGTGGTRSGLGEATAIRASDQNGSGVAEGANARNSQAGAEAVNLYHRAFHGSPHDFDKFDSSKIGTGEGAQAYGHGLYFAGKKEVADHYRRALSERQAKLNPGDVRDNLAESFPNEIVTKGDAGSVMHAAIYGLSGDEMRSRTPSMRKFDPAKLDDMLQTLQAKVKGHGYEVELAPKEHEYLDWDKPLSEQPHALEKLRKSEYIKPLEKAVKDQWTTAKNVQSLTGADVEGILRTYVKNVPSAGAWADVGHRGNAPLAASRLHEAGIPGIKYLDGSSRNAGKGAHNYVIFNDKDVSVVNKYA